MSRITFIGQLDQMDCGPACLSMIASAYGKKYPLQYIRDNSFITRDGVSLLGIGEAATKIGFDTYPAKITIKDFGKVSLPCVLHWNQNHFVVLIKIYTSLFSRKKKYKIADPAHGIITLTEEKFKKAWLSESSHGIALFLTPTEKFFNAVPPKENKLSLKYLFAYLTPYKKQILYVFLLLLIGSGINLIFPFLTQNLIDKGVSAKSLNVISYILLAQLGLFFGLISFEIIRNWIMLFVGTKISIQIVSDYLKSILRLPIKFFDTKMMGDFNQRIRDNERIEVFLTSQSLLTFFSVITFLVYFGVLWYYASSILFIYLSLTVLSVGWSLFWLKKRGILDYFRFQQRAENQNAIYEIISGVTEMKLNQFEDYKRSKWEEIQQKLFKINIRILKIDQLQRSGFEFLNQLKNIAVTFLAAFYVVQDVLTLGELLSISYIIGQMNSPITQLIQFFRSLQDAELSLERLNEVENHPDEEQKGQVKLDSHKINSQNGIEPGIRLKNLSFQYEGPKSPFVINKINLFIPQGKVTAIVGSSGSGKTTLMKLLLKFYTINVGNVFYNSFDINNLSPNDLRKNCGVVMQDGYIFSDTIERNIAMGEKNIDMKKLDYAIKTANIKDFIDSLPLKSKTKIGASGSGISGGQRQRILIARAVYKSPHYIFFDEATSALDAENEKVIHDNLQVFFQSKTVVIIAHRLSTVKNADQIVVLKKGEIVEIGTHQELVKNKSNYYELVKNQLELGN
ncbi:peptidase domain-containing ABC transporter [Aquimarina algiphila]|uniref:peptidase domain-containing ABC transporter n=1 Tax=Aquimarina algiphila TaxID=2047982 RepID=UPI0023311E82|nr:peptidase domain-containing ABC transporter [Aquimarina algiphila]